MAHGATADALADHIVLDPATRIEELAPRRPNIHSKAPPVKRGHLLLHDELEIAAVMPPGSGLAAFVEGLRTPTLLSELIEPAEIGTASVAWQLVDNLLRRGFAHRWRSATPPDEAQLAALRRDCLEWCGHARWQTHVKVGAPPADMSVDAWVAALVSGVVQVQRRTPVGALVLGLEGLAPEAAALAALADAYHADRFRAHAILIDLPDAAPLSAPLLAAIGRLGATVRVRADLGLTTLDADRVRQLVEARLPVRVLIAAPIAEASAPALATLARGLAEVRATAVELDLDWTIAPPATGTLAEQAAALYAPLEALVDEVGDVRLTGFPDDDEVDQEVLVHRRPPACPLERAARLHHLHRRAHYLLEMEGKNVWSQDVPSEDLWVPLADDLLPNQPALLGLREGSILADVGGGFGRVARRLAPHVGATGQVITMDKEPIISFRARKFIAELGAPTIQVRLGLCQRLPLADASVDAAVMEWGGEIHRDGLVPLAVAEMRRVLRPGGRAAITYRLCNIALDNLTESLAPYPDIVGPFRASFAIDGMRVVAEKYWGVVPLLSAAPLVQFEERYMPRVIDDLRGRRMPVQPDGVDLFLTIVAERTS